MVPGAGADERPQLRLREMRADAAQQHGGSLPTGIVVKNTVVRAAGAVLIAVLIGAAGGVWETVAIKRYEAVEGKSLGLFQTPNGAHYRRWGNEVPLVATLLVLCVYAVVATRIVRTWGTAPLVALWVATIVVGVGVWYYSAFLGMNADGIVL